MIETKTIGTKSKFRSGLMQASLYIIFAIIVLILPLFISAYIEQIVMKVFIFAIFALSLNILWGYTGLPSLGHAAFFGVGGYTVGILLVNYGINNFWIISLCGILLAALFAAILGVPALRMAGAYFLLVTLAMGQLVYSVASKWRTMTAGDTGLGGITLPDLHLPWFTLSNQSYYYLIFVAFIICAFLIYRIIHSPFGEALQGIRENETRMRALGYNTWLYKYIAYIIAGLFAGVAGIFFAPFNGLMSPIHLAIATSTLVMLMVVIGSPSKVFGPVLGAVVVVVLEQLAMIYVPERWPLIFGAVFVLSVMFLREGLSVYLLKVVKKVARGSTAS